MSNKQETEPRAENDVVDVKEMVEEMGVVEEEQVMPLKRFENRREREEDFDSASSCTASTREVGFDSAESSPRNGAGKGKNKDNWGEEDEFETCKGVIAHVPTVEHKVDLSFHLRCFYGSEAVASLLNNKAAETVKQAEEKCQELLERGYLRALHEGDSKGEFSSIKLYYVDQPHGPVQDYALIRSPGNGVYERDFAAGSSLLCALANQYQERGYDDTEEEKDEDVHTLTVFTEEGKATTMVIENFDGRRMTRNSFDEWDFPCGVRLMVIGVKNAQLSLRGFRESHYYVTVCYAGGEEGNEECRSTRPLIQRCESRTVSWMEFVSLGHNVNPNTMLDIRLMIYHRRSVHEEIGHTRISLGDLAARPVRDLVLSDTTTDQVVTNKEHELTLLRIGVEQNSLPVTWMKPSFSYRKGYAKHLMMITRGTRGDIQPFIALARALANNYNWMITICTELPYKSFVKEHAKDLERGCIRFRISGGDTQKRMQGAVAKYAIQCDSATLQHVMLARSEFEFFDSEPAIFHWAKELKPDVLMFGFTMAHLAMIVSEALGIPLIGFVLQPTVIPSAQYPPLHFTNRPKQFENILVTMSQAISNHFRHTSFTSVKSFLESNPFSGTLNSMRRRRGLKPISFLNYQNVFDAMQTNTWMQLQNRRVPLVIPVNKHAFGGKPHDWAVTTAFSNYIFLRGDTVPQLDSRLVSFINFAKDNDSKIVVLAFSSMPIDRVDILKISVRLIKECAKRVCVIALMGDKSAEASSDDKLEEEAYQLQRDGRIFIDKGAPFGRLFPLCDATVIHGGLGTTGEALMAGKPVIITGVLLFDQRFWGRRLFDMGVGPNPIHINKLHGCCVEIADEALDDNSTWAQNAKRVGKRVLETMLADPTGVEINAKMVVEMSQEAPVFSFDGGKLDFEFYSRHRTFRELYSSSKSFRNINTLALRQPLQKNNNNLVVRMVDASMTSAWQFVHWTAFVGSYAIAKYREFF